MSAPRITVDDAAGIAPFEQVREQFADLIASGALAEGDKLPTVRGLAADLQLAPGTVARAYKELEAQGLVVSRSRAGTVVAPSAQAAEVALRHLADALAERAVQAGADDAAVLAIVRSALSEARR
ncbi:MULTISPECIES: GntR family transcriptional regulator [unclassified Phycicoccus]|uniref:GntR family transcriptional regulator n=1 Tax=unclassified Phycicoccus TaxID=2637926 RepID=UPI00070259EC|nr:MULTISPECIES: GntR family transcriptional regulator [unclassified Phycicoccus]KQU67984.1 GntR family transcriptional regulator [Phycicoccus sp. Root101]KQZ90080.1 GntR family transcriptional regulator [Phycicoccus sp. Root563]